MKKYDKLVRDKIPDIIRGKGETAVTHIAGDEEYWTKLKEKLLEEGSEFAADESEGEIVDILEVLDAIIEYKKFDRASIDSLQKKKRDERGGFAGRIVLDES